MRLRKLVPSAISPKRLVGSGETRFRWKLGSFFSHLRAAASTRYLFRHWWFVHTVVRTRKLAEVCEIALPYGFSFNEISAGKCRLAWPAVDFGCLAQSIINVGSSNSSKVWLICQFKTKRGRSQLANAPELPESRILPSILLFPDRVWSGQNTTL